MIALNQRLSKIVKNPHLKNKNEVLLAFVYAILVDVDMVVNKAIWHIQDMGFSKSDVAKIKRMIKKRL